MTPQFVALWDDRKSAFITHVVEQLADYTDADGLAVPQEVRFPEGLRARLTATRWARIVLRAGGGGSGGGL